MQCYLKNEINYNHLTENHMFWVILGHIRVEVLQFKTGVIRQVVSFPWSTAKKGIGWKPGSSQVVSFWVSDWWHLSLINTRWLILTKHSMRDRVVYVVSLFAFSTGCQVVRYCEFRAPSLWSPMNSALDSVVFMMVVITVYISLPGVVHHKTASFVLQDCFFSWW